MLAITKASVLYTFMGVVYTPDQIKTGWYPEPDIHRHAATYILDGLFHSENPPGVQSGLIYGSTAENTANRRSDVDVLVLYDDARANQALTIIKEVFTKADQKYHAPIESNTISILAASAGRHTIDPLFAEYLLDAQQNQHFSVNRPADVFKNSLILPSDREALFQVVECYLAAKIRKFTDGYLEPRQKEIDYSLFQRALEFPLAIGRKVIRLTDNKPVKSVDRARIIEYMDGLLDTHNGSAIHNFQTIIDLDTKYSALLESTIAGETELESYAAELEHIYRFAGRSALLLALSFDTIVQKLR